MKKILLTTIILIICSISVFAIQSIESEVGSIKIELIDYSPAPLQPDTEFIATIRVTNIGNGDIVDLSFEFVSNYLIETNTGRVLIPYLKRGEEIEIKHTFYVLPTTETSIKIFFQYGGSFSEKIASESFTIPLSSLNRNVDFDRVTVTPEKIPPGETAEVKLTIENSALVTLTDINIKLNVTGPFSPIKTTNERRINSLPPTQKAAITFNLVVDPDATLGTYSLPLEISYYDPNKERFTKVSDIGLIVYSKPEYELNLEESDALIRGTSPTLTLSISDISTSDIKFLSMELLSTEDYTVVSNPRVYLGNLEPDDFETTEYTVFIRNCFSCGKEIPLKLRLSYKDSFNEKVVDDASLNVRIYTTKEAKRFGLLPTNGSNSFIYIIIFIILVYMTIREYRKVRDLPTAIKLAIKKFILGIFKIIISIIIHVRWKYIRRIPRKIRIFIAKSR